MKPKAGLFVVMSVPLVALVGLLLALTATKALADNPNLATVVLYDGSLGTLPGDQGFLFVAFPSGPTQTISNGGVILDTSATHGYYAGYFGQEALVPILDQTEGFTVTFAAGLLSETHASNDRAGFSIIVLSDNKGGAEPVVGIELAFWSDEIWAQDDDAAGGLFTHAEGVATDTTAVTLYHLFIFSNTYTLQAGGAPALSGRLRDYSNFTGVPDPYETPNLLFLGDDTASAGARLKLDYVAITTLAEEPQLVYLPLVRRP